MSLFNKKFKLGKYSNSILHLEGEVFIYLYDHPIIEIEINYRKKYIFNLPVDQNSHYLEGDNGGCLCSNSTDTEPTSTSLFTALPAVFYVHTACSW